MKRMRLFSIAVLISSFACTFVKSLPFINRVDTQPTPKKYAYTISGTLNPARETTVPANTRVLVLWFVTTMDPPYLYIFGEGKLDFVSYSFVLNFDGPPPSEALNKFGDSSLGVGFVILTANQKWEKKISAEALSPEEIIGISANHAVIYVDGSFKTVPDSGWVNDFQEGYSVGQGVDVPEGFDKFEPVAPNTIQIIIDDFKNIKFLNWW